MYGRARDHRRCGGSARPDAEPGASARAVYAPDAGHEVVLIEKPWFFGHGGVDPDPVSTGRMYAAISTQGVDVYMQPRKFDAEMHDTMTSDGVPIRFHAIVVLQVSDSVALIKKFGPDWYRNNLEEQFKTMVRQAVRKRGMNGARGSLDSRWRLSGTPTPSSLAW